jgi:periplasmic copper chaperone A
MKQTARRASSFMRPPGLAAVSVVLGLCALTGPAAASQPLTISDAWLRFLTPHIPAAGYFTLYNGGEHEAVLTGATSPDCGKLMLHKSVVLNGSASMQMVADVVVPAHGSTIFQPGGYHLMCTSPSPAIAPGHSVPVSLLFKGGSSVTATFPVYGAKGKPG